MCNLQPARLAWCHGKLYVSGAYANAQNAGGLWEYTLDSKYEVVSSREVVATPQPYKPRAERSAWSILGLACDPRESDDDWKLYFSLSPLFSHDGTYPTIAAPYEGAVCHELSNSAILDLHSCALLGMRASCRHRCKPCCEPTQAAVLQVYYVKPTDPKPVAVKFIEGLSVANGDHVVNGIAFAHDGRLLVAVGSQTNAGIPGALGYLPVSPASN